MAQWRLSRTLIVRDDFFINATSINVRSQTDSCNIGCNVPHWTRIDWTRMDVQWHCNGCGHCSPFGRSIISTKLSLFIGWTETCRAAKRTHKYRTKTLTRIHPFILIQRPSIKVNYGTHALVRYDDMKRKIYEISTTPQLHHNNNNNVMRMWSLNALSQNYTIITLNKYARNYYEMVNENDFVYTEVEVREESETHTQTQRPKINTST